MASRYQEMLLGNPQWFALPDLPPREVSVGLIMELCQGVRSRFGELREAERDLFDLFEENLYTGLFWSDVLFIAEHARKMKKYQRHNIKLASRDENRLEMAFLAAIVIASMDEGVFVSRNLGRIVSDTMMTIAGVHDVPSAWLWWESALPTKENDVKSLMELSYAAFEGTIERDPAEEGLEFAQDVENLLADVQTQLPRVRENRVRKKQGRRDPFGPKKLISK